MRICVRGHTNETLVGWPRPNFLAVCNPNITCILNDTKFNINYICEGHQNVIGWNRLDMNLIKGVHQARRSFPSGHASFSAATMMFLVFYIERRIITSSTYIVVLFKPFVQLSIIVLASFIAMSRVKDYHHHLVDVLFGFFLGIMISLLVVRHCMIWLGSLPIRCDIKKCTP